MKLSEFLKQIDRDETAIIYGSYKNIMEAVKRNGYALRYVKEQTEAVCLEAVKRNGDALSYVNKSIFESEDPDR